MSKPAIQAVAVELYYLPVRTRVPLKFGTQTLTEVTCARVKLTVRDPQGRRAVGWGETPLSVQWGWPSLATYDARHKAMRAFCERLAGAWASFPAMGHPLEVGYDFQEQQLPGLLEKFNAEQAALAVSAAVATTSDLAPTAPAPVASGAGPMPRLAALICCSAFDIALHDAYGQLLDMPVYETYRRDWMSRDLAAFLTPAPDADVSFQDRYPLPDFFSPKPPAHRLKAWHLVGGLDAIDAADYAEDEAPEDGHPTFLRPWIRRDGLKCLKIKLRGNDREWDLHRLRRVGHIAIGESVDWLSADFNCTVRDPAYVVGILDELRDHDPRIYGMLLYVEQPFPYELAEHPIDVRSVSSRKPLFLDESAHDWRAVRLGRELGWTGVALKTCKTQTGAVLSACWAKAHGMTLMVQDLTNPMLAQIPHVQLAAHVGTIMGVETNAMQFYPAASAHEALVHPGLYQRRQGCVDLSTLTGPGMQYRVGEIPRQLPPVACKAGDA